MMRSNLDVVLERLSADHTGEVEHPSAHRSW
jgi:hypothetical protein